MDRRATRQPAHLRLYPALHLAAFNGMRRGELAGLRWGDWQRDTHRISIARSRQVVAGRILEVPVKTRSSRRCIDLDPTTEQLLELWRRHQRRDGHRVEVADPIFTNTHGDALHAESISQLFDRHLARTDIPRIRFSNCATPTLALGRAHLFAHAGCRRARCDRSPTGLRCLRTPRRTLLPDGTSTAPTTSNSDRTV